MSAAKREMIRPEGVASKKDIGAARRESTHCWCRFVDPRVVACTKTCVAAATEMR